jgi:NAD+ synthetase
LRIALAQLDPTPGDIPGNVELIAQAWQRAADDRADLLVVPELAVVGYPPRDLLLRSGVLRAAEAATASLAARFAAGPPAILGTLVANKSGRGRGLFNAAVYVQGGRIVHTYAKRLLPTYDVFDEARYFAAGDAPGVVAVPGGPRIGLLICEDLWIEDRVRGRKLYRADPPGDLLTADLDLVVGISASPYHGGKDAHRAALFAEQAGRLAVPLISVNQVGGNDDVLFDGRSRVFDGRGREVARLAAFEPDYRVVDLAALEPIEPAVDPTTPQARADEIRRALVMGLRDYARKTGFRRALLGLSGGVDSAVTACIAADALGGDSILGVSMPGPFTSSASREDGRDLAARLGVTFKEISIQKSYESVLAELTPHFDGKPFGVAEENLQARLRGVVLMALSNKHGHLVLTTGNKSEVAVGYCTLYGDMNGGLAVLSDVWKTTVYDIARLYLAEGRIPERTVTRAPSAELRENQTDQDSLPPYEDLDRLLKLRIEEGLSLGAIVARGEDPGTAERILKLVERNEYKRWQMAPGLRVTPIAFGVGWRMPIARPIDLSGEL